MAVSADISKMYRAVEPAPEDRNLHQFVWRPSPDTPIQDFRMTCATFGVSASPFLTVKTITLPTHFSSTKRGISSDIARTFDVLGWLARTIITMKIMYRKLWEEKLEWDAPVPEPHLTNHLTWRQELLPLSDLHNLDVIILQHIESG